MFARMPETRAKRERSAWGTTASVVVHGGVILLAVTGTGGATPATWRPASVQRDTIIYVAPREVEDGQSQEQGSAARGPLRRPRDLTLPTDRPAPARFDGPLPDFIDRRMNFLPGDTSLANEIARGSERGGGVSTAGTLFDNSTVDRDVRVTSERPPRYPETLRALGISGEVTVRFVVDTTGRIEPGSLRVSESPESPRAEFIAAVVAALRDTRFLPGEVGGRRVRVLVQRSFRFELEGVR